MDNIKKGKDKMNKKDKEILRKIKRNLKLGKAQEIGKCCRDVKLSFCVSTKVGSIINGYNTREDEEGYEEWLVLKVNKKDFYNNSIVQRILNPIKSPREIY